MPTPEQEKKQLETIDISGIEIFEEGVWNGDRYESKDIQDMLDAFGQVGFQPPVIRAKAKLGHADGQEDEDKAREVFGAPALGHVSRIYKVGKKLLADLVKVPKRIAELIKVGAYDRVSAEIYWDYKDGNGGRKHPRVLKAISFLGADIPALTNLKTIESLYKKLSDGPAHVFEDNGNEFRAYCMDCSAGLIAPGMPFSDYLLRYPRKSKEDAGYGSSEGGQERCLNCKFWIGGYNACSIVEGWIEPDGVSDFFEARPGLATMAKKKDEIRNYTVEKRGDQWCLIAKSDGKTLGCHDTEEGAIAQERAIQANKHSEGRPMEIKLNMTREEVSRVCAPCGEKMTERGISALTFTAEQVAKFAEHGDLEKCMTKADMVEKYPDENKRKTACEKAVGEALMQAIQETKGGPNMDEKKFEQEKARLIADKKAADEKAKEYQDKLATLEAANEEAKGKESEALKEVKKLKRERWEDQISSWVAAQKRAGKLAPVEEPRLAAIFSVLYEDQRTVTFAQADGKEAKEPLADAIKAFIIGRPNIFKVLSHATDEPTEPLADAGEEIDRKTKEHMAKTGMKTEQYAEAMKAMLALDENEDLAVRYVRMEKQ